MKYTFASGAYYEGDVLNELFEGQGCLYFSNGDTYRGQFSQDMFEGNGEYIYQSGDKYKGPFSKDVFHGIGTYIFADGSVEKGKFHQDKRVGKFFHYDKDTNEYYEIIYNNDKVAKCTNVQESSIPVEKKPQF